MSTFSQDKANAKGAAASVDKDAPTAEAIKTADDATTQQEVQADDPNKPTSILDESAAETADRHVASTEMPVADVTDPGTQARELDEDGEPLEDEDGEPIFKTAAAEDAAEKIVPGAAEGPYVDGTVVNDHGKPAYAPPGSHNAAMNGVQEDAAGHVDSVNTDNSSKSGVRI